MQFNVLTDMHLIRMLSAGARPTEAPFENFTWDPFIRKTAIFIRFCRSCIFVRFLINEPDGYESRQPCKADETFIVVGTLISLYSFQLTDMFLRKIRLRLFLHLRTRV